MDKATKLQFPAKYGTVQLISRIYGLSAPAVVRILRDYREYIDYAEVKRPGKRSGRRLVNLESFGAWFDSQRVGAGRDKIAA
jgi:hypothetical protein